MHSQKTIFLGVVNNLRIHSEPQRSQIALSDLVLLAISGPGLGSGGPGSVHLEFQESGVSGICQEHRSNEQGS